MMTSCDVCSIPIDADKEKYTRVQRGYFPMTNDADDDNVKAEIFICTKCYLEDEDLCRFFNKIGHRIR